MARKASRGGMMSAAKRRAAAHPGGRGPVRSRPAGRKIMGKRVLRRDMFDWI